VIRRFIVFSIGLLLFTSTVMAADRIFASAEEGRGGRLVVSIEVATGAVTPVAVVDNSNEVIVANWSIAGIGAL